MAKIITKRQNMNYFIVLANLFAAI